MRSMNRILWSLIFGAMLVFHAPVFGDDIDDEVPDVTARVSRISFIRGDVQIKRTGNDDWEKAVLNLPIVEGDEITTGPGERLEIQLNIYSYIRLSENSYLKVVGLQDGAVALSLSEGTMTVRLTAFDKDSAFFEIDAPRTTIAVQKAGMYRVDAGKAGSDEVRVTVTNEGEARVYAENSGFTLRDGRTATVKIEGPLSGEWDTAAASFSYDEFDAWSVDRDTLIAKRLQDAHYDKYYDRDIYGAEDLNDNGEWVYTRTYGHVWRPHRSSISQYADWSPYRYGHWRWVPPYGWTWVNDEPWGWATYHHGRWFYDNGYWYWSPYGHVRRSRSWWAPALVGITIVRNIVCWYPLPYTHNYYNYNYYYGGWGGPRGPRGGHHGGPRGGNQGGAVPTPTPSAVAVKGKPRLTRLSPVVDIVPTGAVVTIPLSSFGRDKAGVTRAAPVQAKEALTRALSQADPVRILPTYQELDGKVSPAIKSAKPRNAVVAIKPTGAATRNADGQPMDRVLQATKIFGDRQPVRPDAVRQPIVQGEAPPRKTGAVIRVPVQPRVDEDPVRQVPRDVMPVKPNRQPPSQPDPVYTQPTKPRIDREPEPVRQPEYTPPPRKERADPVRQQPESSPPPTRSEPQRKNDPPPSRSEPSKSSPPPSRSEPSKSDSNDTAPPQRKGKG